MHADGTICFMRPKPNFQIHFRLDKIIDKRRQMFTKSSPEKSHYIKDIAERAGLNYRTVLNIYNRRNVRIEVETIGALAAALDVDPGELFEYKT